MTTAAAADTLVLNHRPIVTFRAQLLGRAPAERAALGRAAIDAALTRGGPGHVKVWLESPTARVRRATGASRARDAGIHGAAAGLVVDDSIVFYLVPGDLDDLEDPDLAGAAEDIRARLQRAVLEVRERTDPQRVALGIAYAVGATAGAFLLLRGALALRRRAMRRLRAVLYRWDSPREGENLVRTYAHHIWTTLDSLAMVLWWALCLLVMDLWLTFVLRQFAYTRPWAERSSRWLFDVLADFALAIAESIPGIVTAVLIFVLARLVSRGLTALMDRAARGDLVLGWLDADTAGPTRRVGNGLIWLFALAMAYPFLPGASSEAFKGVSVLAGLMLSLGASGVVGQVVSGLSLMYSRALRSGEYVRIGDIEGTVATVGMFATKIQTGLGEEVSLPNAVVFSQPVRNFSRLSENGRYVLQTSVTIGYTTPWRQVHAMLLEAARRTPDVAQDPAPYVVQSALSDFYVEYRLCAHADRHAPERRAELLSQLLSHIQDVFNEHGVQIMSPHYVGDPAEPQVVPPARWYTPPAS
ncbi:MAG: mechanosensitive ion channel family protein [Gammaproteobacteria bacterium]